MCFGGKGGGGHQGGGSSQEDAEIRRSHSEAGISAAETRRHFRERDNPAHSRNENAAGATKSVSHSRDEGGNLIAKQVEYGQGNFAPPQGEREGRMKAENIFRKRNDVRQIGNDLDIGGTIFKNATLSKSGNSIISTDPNNVGTMGGITSGGGLWGGNKIKSVLGVTDGVGAVNSRGIGTSLITPVLDNQRRSRTAKYQAQSDLFKNSTPEQIEAIRAANRKKNPADRDGDGSWLTSTDNMGRVAGIGSRGDGSGAQPYIFDPTLGKEYQALPQLDPNRGADPNLTTFGKFMRKAGGPIVANMMGPAAPLAGALLFANKLDQKGFIPDFLKGNTGRGTDIGSLEDLKTTPSGEITRGDNFTYAPTRFATSDQNALNPFGALPDRPMLRPEIIANNKKTNSQSRYVNYALNDFGSNDNDSENVNNGVPIQPVIAPYADYAQWMPNSEYIGASSYGGPFSSASQNFASVLPPSIYSRGGSSNSVPTRFVNDRTKQYFTAPNDSYYAEENSDWKQASPYSLA